MADTKVSRRSVLTCGTIVGIAALGGYAGMRLAGRAFEDLDLEIDPAIYTDPERDSIPVDSVISKRNDFYGKRPNIICILTDDMGYGDIGSYGGKSVSTPNIDRLAQEGTRFMSFYSCNALCSPSRAGLMTGRYPHRTGVTFPIWPKDDSFVRKATRKFAEFMARIGAVDLIGGRSIADGLPQSEITISEALKVAGYSTMAIGKWHLGDFTKQPEYHPHLHGFDRFVGFNASNDDWPVAFWRDDKEIISDIGLDQEKYTGLFTEEAVGFIEDNKDNPFFLYVAHKDPHQPCFPSSDFKNVTEGGPHGDTIAEVDWSVGEILACLERNGLEEDTIILFTSDNGPWYNGSPGGFRGRKGQSYEGGFRVPLLARWPGHIPRGGVCNEPAMNIDFFPTLLYLAGLDTPNDRVIDGENIWGLLSGDEEESPHDALFFFHHNELEGVRDGKWKYYRRIHHYVHPVPNDKLNTFVGVVATGSYSYSSESEGGEDTSISILGSWPLLYNLDLDPGENYNVIKKYPEIGEQMQEKIEGWEEEFYKNPRGWLK